MKEIKALSAILKEKFDISFNNEALLVEAMTHSSYANEHKRDEGGSITSVLSFLEMRF